MDVIDRMSDTSVSRLDEISVSISELSVQGSHLSTTANELREMAANQEVVLTSFQCGINRLTRVFRSDRPESPGG